jgi:hypothetical protein
MALKNKIKVYLSFSNELLRFIDEQAEAKKITRTKFINDILKKEHDKKKKELIESVIEGI